MDRALDSALRRGAARIPGLAGLWLFGSRATGRARPDSDVDVAVLLDHAPDDRLAAFREIIEALGEEVAAGDLHVVLLNDAPPALAFQVLRHGHLLHRGDELAVHRFTVRVYREHGDREHVERFFRRATRERVRGAANRG